MIIKLYILKNMKKSKTLLSFLLLICFIIPLIKSETDIFEITLDKNTGELIEKITQEEASKNIYVKGEIDESKKYLLISIISNNLKPSISITKKDYFETLKNEYDYTLISKENKLVLPSSYFNDFDINGFYMNILWEGEFSEFDLQFEYVDNIVLDIGEEFSFFAKNENYENFNIIVNNKNDKFKLKSTIGNIGFILSGGDEKQLSMNVNENKAKQMLNNVFGYWMINDLESYSININVSKNVKFYFKTQIFYDEKDEMNNKIIYEDLYNQLFFVQNNIEECFNLELSEDQNEKDLIILSQEQFSLNIFGSDSIIYSNEYKFNNYELYAISDNLKISNTVNKICIKLNKENSDDISLLHIYLYNKNNKYETISEPLTTGVTYNYILPKKDISLTNVNDHINIHTHSQFFERDSNESDIRGLNAFIKRITGNIKVYTDVCNEYPKCSYNNNSRFHKEIYSIDGLYHTSIKASSDTYSTCNIQHIFVIVCEDEENECQYKILFSDNQEESFIRSGKKISKFLEKYSNHLNFKTQDLYYAYLYSTNNKFVVNLAVYSGDAYLVQINNIKGCKFEEEHFGSDERRIFYCDQDEMDNYYDINNKVEIKIEFSIRAGNNNAVYSLYVYEQKNENNEIYIPVEFAKFDTIKNNNKYKLIDLSKESTEIVTLINPINCKINVTNHNNSLYTYENNYVQFTTFNNKSFVDLYLDKYNNYNFIDKCLFHLSSYIHSNNDSYLIITENKPLKFKLDNSLDNIRIQYLYSMINGMKKIDLQVNLIGNSPIKIKIENSNEDNISEYIIRDSKIITIMNGNIDLPINNLLKIKIYIQLKSSRSIQADNENEALVDLKIITDLDTPNYLKREEQLSNILINDEYKYYIALINKGSSGNYFININNGNIGNIYARLLDSDHIKEIGGWNNRFILPKNNTDKNKLLPFDFENQKLIIEKEHTQYCNKFCYLLIGVNLRSYNNNNLDLNNNIITGFNSYLKMNDNKEDSIDEKHFIKLMNDEYISNYITDQERDYFSFKLNNYNSKLNISFYCDSCIITLVFNDTDFNSKNAKKYVSNGNKIDINLGDNINIRNSTAYVKINTINNENNQKNEDKNNNIKYRYSLKMNSPNPNYMNKSLNLNYIDSSIPEIIEFKSNNTSYYDYVIKLDTYNSDKDINIIAAQNTDNDENNNINNNLKDDIKIYANIVNDDESLDINSWPTEKNHQFPSNSKPSNYLNINKSDIKKQKGKDDKILLVRIYGKKNNKIDLYTNYEDIGNEEEEELFIPGKYQLITVNNSNTNSSFKINIPSNLDMNKDYIYEIKKVNGNGKIKYGEDTYEINDKYDSLSFPIDKNIPKELNKIDINSINTNKSNPYNESFTFLIKYEEKNKLNSLEKIKIGSSKFFSSKDDTESIEHFIPLENVNYDLPININFDTLDISGEDEYKDVIRNNTEIFDINGYLITEDELNDIKNGKISFIENKKKYKYKGKYYLENRHGFLNINKDDIIKFKNNNINKKTYFYFTTKKSKINDKKYNKIKGNINIYPANNIIYPLPEDDYYFNSIDCTKNNSQIYKLGDISKNKNSDISSKTHNLTIYFSTPIEGLKVKIVKGENSTEEDNDYFGIIRKQNNNGKDTIIVSKNIEDAYLLVETPDKLLNKSDNYNTNVDYMFKYRYEYKDNKKDPTNNKNVKYDNSITCDKMKFTDLKTNITLNKIKNSKTNKSIPCNYYIRIYKNNKKIKGQDIKNNYYPKKNISIISNNENDDIYAIYKIESTNPILQNDKDNFTIPIEIDTDEPVYLDVMAEDASNQQVYGYSKVFPNSEDDYDTVDENEENDKKEESENGEGMSLIKYILIGICVLLLLILLIICCIKTCNCCSKKKENKNQKRGLDDITFHTNDNEGLMDNSQSSIN